MATLTIQLTVFGLLLVTVGTSAFSVFGLRQVCYTGNHRTVRVGATWRDRCMKCECTAKGAVCSEPKCANPYRPYHNRTCIRWSADGCCCEEFGCRSGGEVYKIGQSYPFPPGDPCGECLCQMDADFPVCRKRICPPIVCVDPVHLSGECCRRCRKGPNCGFPPLKGVKSTNSAISRPLLYRLSVKVVADDESMMAYTCTCKDPGGLNVCEEKPFVLVP